MKRNKAPARIGPSELMPYLRWLEEELRALDAKSTAQQQTIDALVRENSQQATLIARLGTVEG